MKIKVCGLKEPCNIKEAAAFNANYLGFICYDRSPRFIGGLPSTALEVIPSEISKTGVFVNSDSDTIDMFIDRYGFDTIQLHGNETPEFCNLFRDRVEVIKAFGIDEDFDFDRLKKYIGSVDLFLFDTKTEKHGGSGQSFNWELLNKYKLNVPFFISGGLSLINLEDVIAIEHPLFYGVDLNSKFETAPGIKDIEKLNKAFKILNNINTNEIRG